MSSLVGSIDAAKTLQIDRSTITRWVKAGRITPAVRGTGLRGELFFLRTDVEALAASIAASTTSGGAA